MARARRPVGKAGRNERRKLIATALNNVGVAFVLAGLLQPALGYLQRHQAFALADAWGTAIFVLVAMVMFLFARGVAGRLED